MTLPVGKCWHDSSSVSWGPSFAFWYRGNLRYCIYQSIFAVFIDCFNLPPSTVALSSLSCRLCAHMVHLFYIAVYVTDAKMLIHFLVFRSDRLWVWCRAYLHSCICHGIFRRLHRVHRFLYQRVLGVHFAIQCRGDNGMLRRWIVCCGILKSDYWRELEVCSLCVGQKYVPNGCAQQVFPNVGNRWHPRYVISMLIPRTFTLLWHLLWN